jgi:hypothetical protein
MPRVMRLSRLPQRLLPSLHPCCLYLNPRNIPYGFHHFPLRGAVPGFPVWLDINLSQGGAATWLTWLREALLLDGSTRGVTARAVTYNTDLGITAAVTVMFEFDDGGSIHVRGC